MFNYTFKIRNHYELELNEHSIKVTKEKVEDDALVIGKTWSVSYFNTKKLESIKAFDFKTKKEAEIFLIKELNRRNLI